MKIPFEMECPVSLALEKAKSLVNEKYGIIEHVTRAPFFNDEPKFPLYVAKVRDISKLTDGRNPDATLSGLGITDERAKIKAIGEAIERYSLSLYRKKQLIFDSFKNLSCAVNPLDFSCFTKEVLKNGDYSFCKINSNTKFYWVGGESLINNKQVLLPAQVIYVPYKYENEKIIRFPVSTGAACGTSLYFAIYRGLCEIIERDAFMIYYLNKLKPHRIDLNSIENYNIRKMINTFERYRLEVHCFYLKTDLNIYTFLTVIVDKTGIGPSVSLGLKCSFDAESALLGSLEEAQQSRPWLRNYVSRKKYIKRPIIIKDILDRALYWYPIKMIKNLKFLLSSKNFISFDTFKLSVNEKEYIEKLIKELKNRNIRVFFADITTDKIKSAGFTIVKVLSPEMQPLYFDEEFKSITERVFNVPEMLGYSKKNYKELNKIPHPFL
jgi:ribosomal protein S12 methylthiotransferase accessory factor